MKAVMSDFLVSSKPLVRKLIDRLSKTYSYVSVLGTDTKGKSYVVSKTAIEVKDIIFAERGFVVRIHNGVNYSEYSFNEISEEGLDQIVEEINNKIGKVARIIPANSYEVIEEEAIKQSLFGDIEINPEEISSMEIIHNLTEVKDLALQRSELIANVHVVYNSYHISKIYMSGKKDLEQSYFLGEAFISCVARKAEKTKRYFKSLSGNKGYEIVSKLKDMALEIVDQSIALLDAKPAKPGVYDVICAPDITGLIAHEAFGHGVEMDMFVKNRAKGAEYVGKPVASNISTMHDGAVAADHMASYLFDDEGTLGKDTIVIKDGILQTGISDLLSALKLGTVPTGNGRRQSFERKAYARMTNTFFEGGKDKLEDMIASIKQGYLLEGTFSGMEDPKNWGIQCIALLGKEIIDGKLTGKLISPVVMTGYVPDLLKSITMVSETVELGGAGFCGKGYKEYVKVSDGGPYIKAKVRLG
ncbi:TldD/PmbA family protein [Mobilitalea sibirica]|uniref:TldD/PmbA family protein n=1 Tax=Mobilitalea sibirica TaxID=1462919 RepID=A0A8J7H9E9_9FIRM|nr:TldD/PmbA family protein [Mobilitalea sibirica]MBH1941045.1 TldD/PmbA family protein [Mobilitalea sibirica]